MPKSVSMKIDFNKAMKDEKILSGLVVECEHYQTTGADDNYLVKVNCLGTLVTIDGSEFSEIPTRMTPRHLVGENINFTIIEITDEAIFGSMKRATEILRKPIMDRLEAGEIMKGTVTYTTPYGAYINIDGVLSGLLKNYDFADDGTEVREVYKKYSQIEVKYKKTSENGNILFLPAKKKKGQVLYDVSKIDRGQSYLGKVTDIPINFDCVRVIIDGNNVRVKCDYPDRIPDIKVGDMVVITITKKYYDEEKERYFIFGKIISRVGFYQNQNGRRR
jgi:ribosomal protein S1